MENYLQKSDDIDVIFHSYIEKCMSDEEKKVYCMRHKDGMTLSAIGKKLDMTADEVLCKLEKSCRLLCKIYYCKFFCMGVNGFINYMCENAGSEHDDGINEIISKWEWLITVRWLFETNKKFSKLLNSPIESLCISPRTINALNRGGYTTVRDIVEVPSKRIVRLWNIGEVSIKEIADSLMEKGLKWKAGELLRVFNDMRE